MTEFLDKGAVLDLLKEMGDNYWNNVNCSGDDKDWAAMHYYLGAHGGLKAAARKIGSLESKRGALAQASIKDLIAELKTRPAVQVKEFLDIREGDTWRISGDVPAVMITVADPWRDRS